MLPPVAAVTGSPTFSARTVGAKSSSRQAAQGRVSDVKVKANPQEIKVKKFKFVVYFVSRTFFFCLSEDGEGFWRPLDGSTRRRIISPNLARALAV